MITKGEVYEFSGIYHLILGNARNSLKEMFWVSLSSERNIQELISVENISIVTPRKEWNYIGKISDVDLEQALENFSSRMNEQKCLRK